MKIYWIFTLFAAFLVEVASAQNTNPGRLSGTVTESSNKPVDFATVAVINKQTGQTRSTQTDLQGKFTLTNLNLGTYTLKISFVGYQPYSRDSIILTDNKPAVNLGNLVLSQSKANVLKEVVVQGQRSSIQLGVDRKVFSVEQSLVSEGGSASDLLANVPTVSVDIDGNVALRGSGSVRVLIDGKPSAIGGGDIASVLQALPASSIETIELITNPSSKYDPEGQTGIINIVLKKNKKLGMNGAVSVSAGTQDNYNANTNLNYRDGKLNLYGNYSFRYGNRLGGGFTRTTFLNNNGTVNNNSDGKRLNTGNTAKAGLDYYFNTKTTLGLSANLNLRSGDRNEDINYLYRNYSEALDGTSYRTAREDDKDTGYDLSLDFSRKFKKQGEDLVANFSFGRSKEDEIQHLNQEFYDLAGLKRDTLDSRMNDGLEKATNYNIQLDYTLPINKQQKFETGYRSTIRLEDASQFSQFYNNSSASIETDPAQSNDFNLEDIVHAVYASYQNQLTKNFGFQAGLRAEQAYLNTRYRGLSDNTVTEGNLDYFRIYPSIFLTQKLSGEQQLQLSYTRRVNRPRGWQVNPFTDLSDPNNIRVGNPGLNPEDVHSFELSYMKYFKGLTLTSSAYARQVNDVVEGIQSVIDSTTTLTQFINLTRNRAAGLEVIGRADISKGLNITANVNVFYNKFFGSPENNIAPNSGYNWTSNLTAGIKLPYNLSAQLNANYMAPRVTAQGKSKDMFGADAALKLDLLNKKGSLSFNTRDIFNSRKWGSVTETNLFSRESQRRMQGRMSTLTFSYRFGSSDLPQRNRKSDRSDSPQQDQFPDEGGL